MINKSLILAKILFFGDYLSWIPIEYMVIVYLEFYNPDHSKKNSDTGDYLSWIPI